MIDQHHLGHMLTVTRAPSNTSHNRVLVRLDSLKVLEVKLHHRVSGLQATATLSTLMGKESLVLNITRVILILLYQMLIVKIVVN